MASKQQGEIWWTNLPSPLGWRPVLILTRSAALPHLHSIIVAPLTRSIRWIPSEVVVDESDGLAQKSAITLDNIANVEQDRLMRRITTLSADRMDEVWDALHFTLDLPF